MILLKTKDIPFDLLKYFEPISGHKDVLKISTQPSSIPHYAIYPEKLITPCIKAGCPVGGTVLDPFSGTGTTGVVATKLNRNYIGIELNEEYAKQSKSRIFNNNSLFCVDTENKESK